jgi:class 3 adenylate cyclase
MRCTKCGSDNPLGKKFCGDCGGPLGNPCPKCGADNPVEKRFCGECGTALLNTAPANAPKASPTKLGRTAIQFTAEQPISEPLDGERKTVTALFSDIKGSTELERDLDPEEARAIIDPALTLMIDAVHRYDGYIVQSTGDGIFALFGAPIAHEDHPQRALYSALRMQEETRRYAERLRADGRAPIQIRIGVNSGEVVVRSITTGAGQVEYTPIGHTANLASRMQTLADPGATVISVSTRGLVEGYFALKPLGASRVKGIAEPVNVYEVTGLGPLRTRLQRSAGRGSRSLWPSARNGCDEACGRASQGWTRAASRGDGRGGGRQIPSVLRIQGDLAIGVDGAGSLFCLSWQGVHLPAGD